MPDNRPADAVPLGAVPLEAPARRLHVLLAEDNVVNQHLASRLLERRGHRVTIVTNGIEVLAAIAATLFDLVLMDLQMPVMGGLEATRSIRSSEARDQRRICQSSR